MPRTFLMVSAFLLVSLIPAAAQDGGKRVALIIGNNSYSISPLANAVNDARAVDKALKDAGFKTILKENASKADMEEAAADFASQLGPDDTALFFYAGHGVQIEANNYLVPVDFEAANTVIQAKVRMFAFAQLIDLLANRPKRTIFVLDACRSNPVAQGFSLQAGLAQPQNTGKEIYTIFSTSPGQVAADNPNGRNSWFTEALSDMIGQPGLTIDDTLTRVKARVSEATDGKQTPWTQSSLTTKFYFHPPLNADVEKDPTVTERWMDESKRREQLQEWADAIDLINQVLKKKPGGTLEIAAQAKLLYLETRKQAQEKYDAADFPAAAALYEKALELDPFALDAATRAANSYLLCDRLPDGLRVLRIVRKRGTSDYIQMANAMLTELAPVLPGAGEEVKAGLPDPPPVEEIFRSVHFGVPDFDGGKRYLQSSPVELTHIAKELTAAYPPPAEPVLTATFTSQDPSTQQSFTFKVEVRPSGSTRDLAVRRTGGPTGTVQLDGPQGQTPVLFNGEVIATQVPAKLTLPAGEYNILTIKDGQTLSQQTVQVTANGTSSIVVQR